MTEQEIKTELLKHADELLQYLQVGMKDGVDFAKQQVPLIIQEYLKWGMAEAILYMFVCLLISVVLFTYATKRKRPWNGDRDPSPYLAVTAGLIAFIPFFVNAFTLVQIWIAPRVYLIEQFTKLVKGH